jgi:hypothetical protein
MTLQRKKAPVKHNFCRLDKGLRALEIESPSAISVSHLLLSDQPTALHGTARSRLADSDIPTVRLSSNEVYATEEASKQEVIPKGSPRQVNVSGNVEHICRCAVQNGLARIGP